ARRRLEKAALSCLSLFLQRIFRGCPGVETAPQRECTIPLIPQCFCRARTGLLVWTSTVRDNRGVPSDLADLPRNIICSDAKGTGAFPSGFAPCLRVSCIDENDRLSR